MEDEIDTAQWLTEYSIESTTAIIIFRWTASITTQEICSLISQQTTWPVEIIRAQGNQAQNTSEIRIYPVRTRTMSEN